MSLCFSFISLIKHNFTLAKSPVFPKMFLHQWLILLVTSYQVTVVTLSKTFKVTGPGNVTTIEGTNTNLTCDASNANLINQCTFIHNDRNCTFVLNINEMLNSWKYEALDETCPDLDAKFIGNFNYIPGKTFK